MAIYSVLRGLSATSYVVPPPPPPPPSPPLPPPSPAKPISYTRESSPAPDNMVWVCGPAGGPGVRSLDVDSGAVVCTRVHQA